MLAKAYRWFITPHFGKLKIDGRFIASMCLLLLAVVLAFWRQNTSQWIRLGAMCFSSIGDIILMNAWNIPKRLFKKRSIIAGGASFSIGHLLYAKAFWILIPQMLNNPISLVMSMFGTMILLVIVIEFFLSYHLKLDKLYRFSFIFTLYFLFIAVNGTCAGMLVLSSNMNTVNAIILILGICSFIFSDTIIKLEKTAGLASETWRFNVWATYIIAQVALICVHV